jgi:hypothetical protein
VAAAEAAPRVRMKDLREKPLLKMLVMDMSLDSG